jgi:hypothetical protein
MAKTYIPSITPNPDQAKAVELIKEFMEDPNEQYFTLKARGGYGKTTCISEAFKKEDPKNIGKYYIPSNVLGTTISHQARLVLQNQIPNSKSFASVVGVTMDFTENKENPLEIGFVERPNFENKEMQKIKAIVFDEASMYSVSEQKLLEKAMRGDAKIIMLGDHHQIPPISGKSIAFDYRGFELTIPMRQKEDEPIFDLASTQADIIDTKREMTLRGVPKQLFKNGKGYAFNNNVKKVLDSFINNYKEGIDCRITSFRNDKIKYLNTEIRRRLWGDASKYPFIEGDLLMGKNAYNPTGKPWASPKFYNGQLFKVQSVKTKVIKGIYKSSIQDVKYSADIMKIVDAGFKVWSITSDTVDGVINILHESEKARYYKVCNLLKEYSYMNDDIKTLLDFKAKFAKVEAGFSSTLFSIQGATHHTCYVDLTDVLDTKPLSMENKMKSFYTGITRATDNLCIF